jgi:hypothetical protein
MYARFRVMLIALGLGMAAVYMFNGFSIAWSEVPVDLPKAKSDNVIPVFIDNRRVLTREKNCGKDPRDPQARQECSDEKLFDGRDMSIYRTGHAVCDMSLQDDADRKCSEADARLRLLIWTNWHSRTRAHIVEHWVDGRWQTEWHYFVEPGDDGRWHIVEKEVRHLWFWVDGEETEIKAVVGQYSPIIRVNWKVCSEDDGWGMAGERCLRIIDEDGDEGTI